jgi:O-antigen/teichoic acid export membrane protein
LFGTALSQLIPILGSLVIARLFGPAEFGIFAAWLGMVLLSGVMLTGRFEMVLAIEPDGAPRMSAVHSTLITTVIAACLLASCLIAAMIAMPALMGKVPFLLLIALIPTALAVAVAQTWQSWAAAEGFYKKLSIMRISQATTVTLAQIGSAFFEESAEALGLAYFLGVLVSVVVSALMMPVKIAWDSKKFLELKRFWKKNYKFPILSLPADSINTAAAQMPTLIVASKFGPEIAGLLAMTLKILGAPIGLLGKSVLDVFKRHAATNFRENGECKNDYIKTFKALAAGSFVFCLVMSIVSEDLFALAFGENWRASGTIAIWLIPLFAMRFMASPLSYMVYIAGKQHVDLIWQIALLCMTLSSLGLAYDYEFGLKAYSAGYFFLYVIYLAMSYRFSLGSKK